MDAATARPDRRAAATSAKCPSCNAPMVGTSATSGISANAARNSAIVRAILMRALLTIFCGPSRAPDTVQRGAKRVSETS